MNNVCIVGYGTIAPIHVAAINEAKNAKFYGVCDIIPERANECAKKYNVKAMYSYDQVLEDKNINTVHICTPHHLHTEMTIKAINAGKDVVLEKPVAINEEEFSHLYDEVSKSDRKVCVVFQNRTNQCIKTLREIMETDKSIGKLLAIASSLRWSRTPKYYNSEAWRGKWDTEGGGVLINQAIHLLDLTILLGGKVENVIANISTKYLNDEIEVEDTADALISFKNGARCAFYATNTFPVNLPVMLELVFENAVYRYFDGKLYKTANGATQIVSTDSSKVPGKSYWGGGHVRIVEDFYNALYNKTDNYVSLKDTASSFKTLFAMYKSAKEGKKITL